MMTPSQLPEGTTEHPPVVPTLNDYFAVVWARRRTVALAAAAVVLLAFLLTMLKPVADASESYTAEAQVLTKPLPTTVEGQTVLPNMATETSLVLSDLILDAARENLDAPAEEALSSLSATSVPNTEIIAISATSAIERAAADAVEAVADAYVTYRVETATEVLESMEDAAQKRQAELARRAKEISLQIQDAAQDGDKVRVRVLQSERSAVLLRLDDTRNQILQLQSLGASDYGALQVGDAVEAPVSTAVSTRPVARNLVLALLLGLLIGIGLVLLQGLLDRRIYTELDVEQRLGVSVVGVRPDSQMGEHIYSMLSVWLCDADEWSVHLHGESQRASVIARAIRDTAHLRNKVVAEPLTADSEDGGGGATSTTGTGLSVEGVRAMLQENRKDSSLVIVKTESPTDGQVAASVTNISLPVLEAGRASEDDTRDLIRRLRNAGAAKVAVILLHPRSERFRM